MKHQQVPVEIKAQDEGRFSALAAVWDVIDRVGDRMLRGAFGESLRKWRQSGKRIPVVWSHGTDDPEKVIGSADPNDVRETTSGLQVDGVLDIADSPTARRVFELLKTGTISGWSFGYVTKRQRHRKGANEIQEVELLELGPTVSPANPATATLGVKDMESGPPSENGGKSEPTVPSRAELRARSDELLADIDTKSDEPISVASFEV